MSFKNSQRSMIKEIDWITELNRWRTLSDRTRVEMELGSLNAGIEHWQKNLCYHLLMQTMWQLVYDTRKVGQA